MPANRWRAIADDLRRRIERGEWDAGAVLPTQRDLMREYETTAQGTVARALSALIDEGVLIADPSAPRRGTRVRSQRQVRRNLHAGLRMEYEQARTGEHGDVGLFEQMTDTASDALDVAVSYESAEADSSIASVLEVPTGAPLLVRTFRYAIEGTPHQLVTSYLAKEIADTANLTDASCERPGVGTIAQLWDAGIEVEDVAITLEARLPTPDEVAALAVRSGVPVFAHERVMFARNERPVEMSRAVIAGDRVAYSLRINLPSGQSS